MPANSTSATGKPPETLTVKDISLELAHVVLEAAVAKAKELGLKMDIAVVDAGGNLKAFARMDGAWLGTIDIAMKKATHRPLLRHAHRRDRQALPARRARSTRSRSPTAA